VTVDGSGNLVIDDQGNDRVRVVAAGTGMFYGQMMTADDIYTVAGNGKGPKALCCSGDQATSALLLEPAAVASDQAGNTLVAESKQVQAVAAATGTFYGRAMTAGHLYTVAGGGTGLTSGVPATKAALTGPHGLTIDGAGDLAFVNTNGDSVWLVAPQAGTFYGQTMKAGDIYEVAGTGTLGFSGDGGPAASAELAWPTDVTATAAGTLLITDSLNDRVRQVEG
jgi:hypothetical protein